MLGVGIDVVEIDRFRRALERTPSLRTRLFTSEELATMVGKRDDASSLAARFAAREATKCVQLTACYAHLAAWGALTCRFARLSLRGALPFRLAVLRLAALALVGVDEAWGQGIASDLREQGRRVCTVSTSAHPRGGGDPVLGLRLLH